MHVIYALVDPRDNAVCYVGMTSDIRKRFIAHVKCLEDNKLKNMWVDELLAFGMLPICKTLETVYTLNEAREREIYWIRHYEDLKMPLTNTESVSPNTIARMELRTLSKTVVTVEEEPIEVEVKPHPMMNEVQALQFKALYPVLGTQEALRQMKCGNRYWTHAKQLIREHKLERKEA